MSISEISRTLYLSVALVLNMKLIEFRYQETFINYFNLKLVDFDGDWKANTFTLSLRSNSKSYTLSPAYTI